MSDEKKLMEIVNEDGSIKIVEILSVFEFEDTKKEYVLYTDNIIGEDGFIQISCSGLDRTANGGPALTGISSLEETN